MQIDDRVHENIIIIGDETYGRPTCLIGESSETDMPDQIPYIIPI